MAADPLRLGPDGDRFDLLYREYAAEVYRYALAVMRNPADAEDVTQTTFLNAWRAFSGGEEPREPLNWFIAIAHNVCRLKFRTRSRRPKEVEFEPALAEAPAAQGPSAGDVLEALSDLPSKQRSALVMRELEGRSYPEIASILGVSRPAVETLIFRARRSVRSKRDAVGTLAALPLPLGPLRSLVGSESGGAALAGSGAVAKAAAVVVAGVVAVGAAREAIRADAPPAQRAAVPARVETSRPPTAALVPVTRPAAAAPARPPAAPRTPAPSARPSRASTRPPAPAAAVAPEPEPAAPTAVAPELAAPAGSVPNGSPEPAPPAAAPAAPAPPPPPAPPRAELELPGLPAVPLPALPRLPPLPALPPVVELPPVPELPPLDGTVVEPPPPLG